MGDQFSYGHPGFTDLTGGRYHLTGGPVYEQGHG